MNLKRKKLKISFNVTPSFSCWIRPDYIVPAVVLPLSLLGVNSMFVFSIISIKVLFAGRIFGISLGFGNSSVRRLVSMNSSITSAQSTASSVAQKSYNRKFIERAFILLCVQIMLGLPWVRTIHLSQKFLLFSYVNIWPFLHHI